MADSLARKVAQQIENKWSCPDCSYRGAPDNNAEMAASVSSRANTTKMLMGKWLARAAGVLKGA